MLHNAAPVPRRAFFTPHQTGGVQHGCAGVHARFLVLAPSQTGCPTPRLSHMCESSCSSTLSNRGRPTLALVAHLQAHRSGTPSKQRVAASGEDATQTQCRSSALSNTGRPTHTARPKSRLKSSSTPSNRGCPTHPAGVPIHLLCSSTLSN